MIRLLYHGRNRILEPHDHGILNGSVQLLAYQVGGSSSRPLPNWVLMKSNDITDLELLDQIFPGGRPTVFDLPIMPTQACRKLTDMSRWKPHRFISTPTLR